MTQKGLAYRRVILKLSGEGLAGAEGFGIGAEQLRRVAAAIAEVARLGVQLGVVVGGGNFLRGGGFASKSGIVEATAHHMGMLATVMNGLALQEALESAGAEARVTSAVAVASICEPYVRRRCLRHLEKGRVVVLAGGTGRPFVTTDTAAALAAAELGADAVLKATQVDGVYNADPRKDPGAKRYSRLSYDRVIDERLKAMDISAVDLCQGQGIPIVVFNLHEPGSLKAVILGEHVGTVIAGDE